MEEKTESKQLTDFGVILIAGHKRAGKDTLGGFIKDLVGNRRPVYLMSFASRLKQGCKEMFNLSDECMENKDAKYDGISARIIYQLMGTEVIQNIFPELLEKKAGIKWDGKHHWARLVCQDIKKIDASNNPLFVITDTRFPAEIEYCRSQFGNNMIVVSIKREQSIDEHISESFFNYILSDIHFDNVGDISELALFAGRLQYEYKL